MVSIFQGGLEISALIGEWHAIVSAKNMGAFALFVGTARDENGISALSFDIYRPLLERWFDDWQTRAAARGATIFMAHSEGDVPIGKSSYAAAIASPKRRVALELLDDFVEDFKKNAPIWKYDLIDGKRIFAYDRASLLPKSGILATL
ncbi:molybdenum cofactor biosynthesis protein MoaE [Campylobacterota bacterium]|nr:molybdenum cofactor biosynthesis protein MoaE [Campylobacterota bacterium]